MSAGGDPDGIAPGGPPERLPDGLSVVTFDVFDTLLHRRVRAPVDLFELVRLQAFESDFALCHHDFLDGYAKARREAEAAARARRKAEGEEGEIRLDEIFGQMQRDHDLPDDLVDHLKASELALEEAVLFASPEGLALYRAARAQGLAVGFLSDMYLPADWIAAKLEAEGFEGASGLPLYVSGEYRVTKRSGALYRLAGREQGWALDQTWLHVGDHEAADIARAKSEGLRTRLADWADVKNRPQPEERDYGANAVAAIAGFATCRPALAFQPEDPLGRIGYQVFGPLLFGFALWLLAEAQRRKLDRMLFIARDGQLPMRLFDRLKDRAGCGGIGSVYVYTSRKLGYLTGMREWDAAQTRRITDGRSARSARAVFRTLGLDAGDYREELGRFGIDDPDRPIPPAGTGPLRRALDAVSLEVLAENAARRRDMQPYFAAALDGAERVGFVDIGWVGNIQRLFANALPPETDRSRLVGLYLGHLPGSAVNAARGIAMHSFMTRGALCAPIQAALHAGGLALLEFALTADHGSTIGLERGANGTIQPVLDTPSEAERHYAEAALAVQDGILRFADENAYLLDHLAPSSLASPHWAGPFLRLTCDPTAAEIDALADLTHSDGVGSNAERLPLVAPLAGWRRVSPPHRRRGREASYWKAGFDRRAALL